MQDITRRQFLAALAGLAAVAIPRPAEAMAVKFRKCPTVIQNGVTYRLYQRYAIVQRTPNRKSVTIPNAIKAGGKTYTVTAIWDRTFSRTPKVQRVILKARNLETIEDPAIFRGKISVTAYDRATYAWLKRGGVKVTLHK